MFQKLILIGSFIMLCSIKGLPVNADETRLQTAVLPAETEDLYNFIAGRYHIIGRYPDSEKTYTGVIIVDRADSGVRISRIIGRKKTSAQGVIRKSLTENIPLLQLSFKEQGLLYEASYMIHTDLNNYARLTGYIYNNSTKKAGIEAWFADYEQPGQ